MRFLGAQVCVPRGGTGAGTGTATRAGEPGGRGDGLWRASQAWIRAAGRGVGGGGVSASEGA